MKEVDRVISQVKAILKGEHAELYKQFVFILANRAYECPNSGLTMLETVLNMQYEIIKSRKDYQGGCIYAKNPDKMPVPCKEHGCSGVKPIKKHLRLVSGSGAIGFKKGKNNGPVS